MNYTGMVEICAEEFDLCSNCGSGSYDNCTPQEDLIFSFSANVNDTCRVLTCDDIPNGESAFIEFEIWVTDLAGNQDYCTVTLDLQDNEADACEDIDPGAIVVSGQILDPNHQSMPGVEVKLEDEQSNIGFPRYEFTSSSGIYIFNNLYENHNYQVTPFNDTDHAKGVSTLDLIHIQRHLLGLEALADPLQIIAADADNNEKISASDLLVIRNLILGTTDQFTNGQSSYRFVSYWENFAIPSDPFPFTETVFTDDIKSLLNKVNWTGIKIGDVNQSASPISGENVLEPRSENKAELITDDQVFEAGEPIELIFRLEGSEKLTGGQFTIEFNSDVLHFEQVLAENALISMNNFGLRYAGQGLITASWNSAGDQPISEGKLFRLSFRAISDGRLSEVIKLTDRITRTEGYNENLEVCGITLRFDDGEMMHDARTYSLYQNIPNPFSDLTEILFELPEDAEATLSFYDMTGKQIKVISDQFRKGINTLEISKSELNTTGVIYYQLRTGLFTQTRKMICIN